MTYSVVFSERYGIVNQALGLVGIDGGSRGFEADPGRLRGQTRACPDAAIANAGYEFLFANHAVQWVPWPPAGRS